MIKIEKMIFVVLINLYLILYLNYKNKIMCKQPFDFQRYIILSKPQFRPTFVSFTLLSHIFLERQQAVALCMTIAY